MPKVQVATAEEVEAFLTENLPEAVAVPVANMITAMMESHSVAGETETAKPSRRRPAPAADDDDQEEAAPPARRPGRRPADDDQEEVEAKPAKKSGRRPAATDDDDEEGDLLKEGDLIDADQEGDDDAQAAKPAGRRPRPAADDDDQEEVEAKPAKKPGKPKTVNPTFKALGLDPATIKGHVKSYLDEYTAKEMKAEIADNNRITLKGTDTALLAKQAANIYEADTQLKVMSLEDLEEQAAAFGLEPDLAGKRGDKAKKLAIIDEIIAACLENLA